MKSSLAPFRAGVARANITPLPGTHLSGSVNTVRKFKAGAIADPLYARALVLASGEHKLCIVTVDITLLTEPITLAIRQAAQKECGLEPEAVMVHATQTHSAPSLGHCMLDADFAIVPPEMEWVRGGDPANDKFVVPIIIDAIKRANDDLQPASLGAGSGIEGRFAFNRRAVMRDGKVFMPHEPWKNHPLGPTDLLQMEGPIDPEVGVLAVRAESGKLISILVNYTCHPVHVFPKAVVSADWPGALCDALAAQYDDCIPLVINGCCGNINPWPPFDPHYEYNGDHVAMGNALAEMAGKVVETLEWQDEGTLDWCARRVPLEIREPSPEQRATDTELLARHPMAPWDENQGEEGGVDYAWMRAASNTSISLLKQREGVINYEIQAFRIGETALVGLPGEPFVEGQLQLKAASPVRQTYVAHCTTQYVGYLAIPEAFPRGGHEVDSSFWAKVEPEALGMIIDNATELLSELFPTPN
ncbi:MAG: hypothetical protein ABI210_13035 [Abditibacteriaceae bacterium]